MTAELPPDAVPLAALTPASLESLPTLPVLALQLGELVHSRRVSVPHVAELLRGDPATSAKLLRLVNSPYFGIPGGVSDVARAIPFIGFNSLYHLVLGVSVLETLDGEGSIERIWIHSLAVAITARELALEIRHGDPGACFTAGLLHDMGKIATAKLEPARYAAASVLAAREGVSMAITELRVGLPGHDRVGSQLAKHWRFPATLAVPIEHHHEIARPAVRGRLAPTLRTLTEIVAAADHLAHAAEHTFDGERRLPEGGTGEELLARVGLSAAQRAHVVARTRHALESSRTFLALLR